MTVGMLLNLLRWASHFGSGQSRVGGKGQSTLG
jgi:hypothetical protein